MADPPSGLSRERIPSVIKYIGSKRVLLPAILDAVARCSGRAGGVRTVLDLFSGTSRVGHALKSHGYRVLANDHNAYACTLAACYVRADAADVLPAAARLVAEFNALPGSPGYLTETFALRARYFHPRNAERIDAIREAIAFKALPPDLEAVMLTSLMEAADRVDSTTGVQMAYLKSWAPRAHQLLELRLPVVLPRAKWGRGEAHALDALDAVERLEADLAYLDPPYNQHSYLGNYHIWESLVRWDKPAYYGVACKRADTRDRRSVFNSRPAFPEAMRRVLSGVRAPFLIVSCSNEGYMPGPQMEALLGEIVGAGRPGGGRVVSMEYDFRRYIGARIGIHNPKGVRVGTVSHLTNKEYLLLAARPGHAERLEGVEPFERVVA